MYQKVSTPYGDGLLVEKGMYRDGSIALGIIDDQTGEPICTLTVNMDTGPLPKGHFLVKTWSENESTARSLLEQGIFKDTGERVSNGYVDAQIWKLSC